MDIIIFLFLKDRNVSLNQIFNLTAQFLTFADSYFILLFLNIFFIIGISPSFLILFFIISIIVSFSSN